VQVDEAEENPPADGGRGGDCSIVDDEIDAALIALLVDLPGPLNESLASASELIRVPSMLDSWELEPAVQAALLEEPLSFDWGSPDSRLLSEQMTVAIPLDCFGRVPELLTIGTACSSSTKPGCILTSNPTPTRYSLPRTASRKPSKRMISR